jgi:hypothetical protein
MTQAPYDLKAIQVGQTEVEYDQIDGTVAQRFQRTVSVLGFDHLKALCGQARAQEAPDRLVVIYDEHVLK